MLRVLGLVLDNHHTRRRAIRAYVAAEQEALRARTAPRGGVLRYWSGRYVMGIIGTLFLGPSTIWILFGLRDAPPLWLPAVFAGFAVASLGQVVSCRRVRCQPTPRGFDFVPLLSRRVVVKWSAIEAVGWGRWNQIVFRLHDGAVVRVPATLVGIPWFSGRVLSSVHRTRIDAKAYAALSKLAKGGVAVGFGVVA
jgi:hypothetical protein